MCAIANAGCARWCRPRLQAVVPSPASICATFALGLARASDGRWAAEPTEPPNEALTEAANSHSELPPPTYTAMPQANEQTNEYRGEIFVVDDDTAIRDLFAMLFGNHGYK